VDCGIFKNKWAAEPRLSRVVMERMWRRLDMRRRKEERKNIMSRYGKRVVLRVLSPFGMTIRMMFNRSKKFSREGNVKEMETSLTR